MTEFDVITKPEHYNQHPSGIEPKDLLAGREHRAACAGKYLLRHPYKGASAQDLNKAAEYLRMILAVPEGDDGSVLSRFRRFVQGDPRATETDALALDVIAASMLTPEMQVHVYPALIERIEALVAQEGDEFDPSKPLSL